MSKEIKSLEELLEQKANKSPSELRAPRKKSFFENAKKSIQEHQEAKAAIRKAEREKIEKERKEAAEKAKRERPIRVSLPKKRLTEANIIKILRENKSERPIEIIVDIGSYIADIGPNYYQAKSERQKINNANSSTYVFLEHFDRTYGTRHKTETNTKTETHETNCYVNPLNSKDKIIETITIERGEIQAILPISPEKKKEILQKFFAEGLNNKYTQTNQSDLFKVIKGRIAQNIDARLTQAYNNEVSHFDIFFHISSQEMTSNIFSAIRYIDFQYGKMSKDAMYALALLTEEYTQNLCYSNPYSQSIQLYFIDEIIENGNTKLRICVRFVPKPNTTLKKL